MKKKIILFTSFIFVVTLALSLVLCGRNNIDEVHFSLKYASGPIPLEAPVHVALNKTFFEKQGLQVQLQLYPDGKTALNAIFQKEVHIAAVMATPVVFSAFERDDFVIFGVLDHTKFHSMIARKSKGIAKPQDLKGKRVGVTAGTSGEFFMHAFLITHNLLPSDLNIVYQPGPQLVHTLQEGQIDAMFSWIPYIPQAAQKIGSDGITFQSSQFVHPSWLYVTSKSFAQNNSKLLSAFLYAVEQGLTHMAAYPQKALMLHCREAGVDSSLISDYFYNTQFSLSLRQSLLMELERQARWLIDAGYIEAQQMPNFLNLMLPEPLNRLAPAKVTLRK